MMSRLITCGTGTLLLLCTLFLSGCATPIGVDHVSPREAYKNTYANPLVADVASDNAKYVLKRYFLLEQFKRDPAATIAALHEKALHDDRRDILYALAEAAYLYANQLAKSGEPDPAIALAEGDAPFADRLTKSAEKDRALAPDYFLLSAFYAYHFLLDERADPPPSRFDQRVRIALDLYNFGLWQGLSTGEHGGLVLKDQTRILPFGQLTISLDTAYLHGEMKEYKKFEPTYKYEVRGVSVRNRTSGVGAPLIGIKDKPTASGPGQVVPLTMFLRLPGGLADLSSGTATAVLELYSVQDTSTLQIKDRTVPLETDTTTPLAYNLEGSEVWGFGMMAFLGKEKGRLPDGLYLQEPYQPGKIPVVFVHGTASSPVWWTEMFNTLRFDPLIRQKYQFWYFIYSSSRPIVMSAADLRDALRDKVTQLDPSGKDPALQQMVVIGHSQGGLLTKLTAVDSGDRLLRAFTGQDLDSIKLPTDKKKELRRLTYIKPLPFVKEVVFLSTPHRGSFRSKWWNRSLVKSLVTFPAKVLQTSRDYYDYMTDDVKKLLGGRTTVFTSADGMSPGSPLLQTLADIPLAPWVKGHSIIAVKGSGDPKLGNDGVVEYSSAHLEGMESEFIVNSDHSSQLHPLAIDEVRRILVEHLPDLALDNRETIRPEE